LCHPEQLLLFRQKGEDYPSADLAGAVKLTNLDMAVANSMSINMLTRGTKDTTMKARAHCLNCLNWEALVPDLVPGLALLLLGAETLKMSLKGYGLCFIT